MIRLYEINNTSVENPVLTLEGHTNSVTSLGFQRDGRYLYSGSEDGACPFCFCHLSLTGEQLFCTLVVSLSVCFSFVFVVGTVKLWDLRSRTYSRSFDSKGPVTSVSLRTNRDQIISGDQNGSVKIWDLASGKCINDVKPSPNMPISIQAVYISDDERTMVAVSNHAVVFVWDPTNPENLKPLTKFRAHPVGSYCLHAIISPDSRTLVTTSSDKTAKLWDTTTWELTATLSKHTKWVWDAAFCADSSYLVTASSDHTARLWNLRNAEVVREYKGHPSPVTCVALNDSSC